MAVQNRYPSSLEDLPIAQGTLSTLSTVSYLETLAQITDHRFPLRRLLYPVELSGVATLIWSGEAIWTMKDGRHSIPPFLSPVPSPLLVAHRDETTLPLIKPWSLRLTSPGSRGGRRLSGGEPKARSTVQVRRGSLVRSRPTCLAGTPGDRDSKVWSILVLRRIALV